MNVFDSMLDVTFVKMASAVQNTYEDVLVSRQECLRCENWVRTLAEMLCCDKVPLLKIRNNYMKQLLRCVSEIGSLVGVFRKMPPAGSHELKNLQKHEVLEIEFAAKSAIAKRKQEEARRNLSE